MSFIYVTGATGSGKSALAKALRAKGTDAYDEDDPNIGSAHDLKTGKPVSVPPAEERNPDWFSQHEWRVLDKAKRQLKAASTNKAILLFGNSIQPGEQAKLFDQTIYLKIDEETLRNRIRNRHDNDYGKSEHEMQVILNRKHLMDERYNATTATILDATQPLEKVASDIRQTLAR